MRPWDISITKVTFALLFNSVLLLVIVLSVAHWYRKRPRGALAPGGFIGFMEMFIMMVNDDIIKSCVGPNYRKFAPYLLTAFFFIFVNNIMGLIPFFPGGANVEILRSQWYWLSVRSLRLIFSEPNIIGKIFSGRMYLGG